MICGSSTCRSLKSAGRSCDSGGTYEGTRRWRVAFFFARDIRSNGSSSARGGPRQQLGQAGPAPTLEEPNVRRHLTPTEIARLIEAAGKVGRHGHRDTALLLICYRFGLRVSELVGLRWEQANLTEAVLHVRRLKHGTPDLGEAWQGPTSGRRGLPRRPRSFSQYQAGRPKEPRIVRTCQTALR